MKKLSSLLSTYIILLVVVSITLLVFLYQLYFEKHFKAQSTLTEIESLQIDSTKTTQYPFESSKTNLEFWVGGKYKIDITNTDSKPFSSTYRHEVYVRDIGGNFVMTYDTKYHYSMFDCWESDYIRLMKYLNIQHR